MLSKKRIFLLLSMLLIGGFFSALVSAEAEQQPVKIGVINLDKALKAHPKFSEVDETLRDLFEERQAELTKMGDERDELEKKIEEGTATAEEKDKLEQIKKTAQKLLDKYQAEIDTKKDELVGKLLVDIMSAIKQVGEEESYGLIVQEMIGEIQYIVYFDNSLDITDKVMAKVKENLEREKESESEAEDK